MSALHRDVLADFYRATRDVLSKKLRQSRLAPVMKDVGKNSRPGFTDLGVVTGFEDRDFVNRFGASLQKVEDADIAVLTLYLPPQDSLMASLGELVEHVGAAPEGKTGLPYFDEWVPADDSPPAEAPLVWSHSNQDEPRGLLAQGYRIGKGNLPPTALPESLYLSS